MSRPTPRSVSIRRHRCPAALVVLLGLGVLDGCATTGGAAATPALVEAAEAARVASERAAYATAADADDAEAAAAATWLAYERARAQAVADGTLARTEIALRGDRARARDRVSEWISTMPFAGRTSSAPDRSYVFLWRVGDDLPWGLAVYSWPSDHDRVVAEARRIIGAGR